VTLPIPSDPTTAPWWEATGERRLLLQRCAGCGAVQHPPGPVCRACGGVELGWSEASGQGTIDSYTVIARTIRDDLPAPYVVARVRLAEGPILLTHVVEGEPACDRPVTLDWRLLADGRALPVFRVTA
jgi:uncharacterized OB-fold protein